MVEMGFKMMEGLTAPFSSMHWRLQMGGAALASKEGRVRAGSGTN